MEYGLGLRLVWRVSNSNEHVLILVLMEYGLGLITLQHVTTQAVS